MGGAALRQIRHPGPVAPVRWQAAGCAATALGLTLPPGLPMIEAVAQGFAAQGFRAGYLRLRDVPLARLDYVIPAAAPDARHAAWYSATRAGGAALIRDAGLHFGWRDGAPFLHCHGVWEVPGQGLRMGHLLPFESVTSDHPVQVTGWGLAGAALVTRPDPETGFALFMPQGEGEDEGEGDCEAAGSAVLLTIRPNAELGTTIVRAAADHGITAARIEGIGSLIGAEFADAPPVASFATEALVTQGRLANGQADLRIALVDMDGDRHEGLLAPRRNTVCVTFELLILPDR